MYTSFNYSRLSANETSVAFTVMNSGSLAGVETSQLYLAFPAAAGAPPKQLKGVAKVDLSAGEAKVVVISLSKRDFSVWDDAVEDWAVVAGSFGVMVGSSPHDIRLQKTVTVTTKQPAPQDP